MNCETCQTERDLLSCGFGDCPYFCAEDMVTHLESTHKDSAAALEMAKQIRSVLKESESGLLQLAQLDGYQTSVFIGLTQVIDPPYSDAEALGFIAKHRDMIADRERRKFTAYVTAQMIHETELVAAKPDAVVRALYDALCNAKQTIRALNGLGMTGEAEQLCWEAYQYYPEMKQINSAIAMVEGDSDDKTTA